MSQPIAMRTPENEITIRRATADDIPALHELIAASVRGLCTQDYPAELMERALGSAFGVDERLVGDGTYFVAVINGTIVGCGGWSYRRLLYGTASVDTAEESGDSNLLDPTREAARIRAFFVHPDWSRRGIGRRILEASEQAAIAAGFRRLELVATRTGEPLYRACGFLPLREVPLTFSSGESVPGTHMGKDVGPVP